MKLDWSKKNMLEYLSILSKKKYLTDYEKYIFKFYYDYLENNLNNYHEKDNIDVKKINQKEILNNLDDLCEEFQYWLDILPKKIRIQFLNQLECLKNLYLLEEPININIKNVNNQELFDQSYEVFNSISPYLSRCLDYIYKNKLVKVDRTKLQDNSGCYIDYANELGYSYIGICPNTSYEAVYNHEVGHSILAVNNKEIYDSFLKETHSIYMNLYTDLERYNKTKDVYYLNSYYNYLVFLQQNLVDLSYIYTLTKIDLNRQSIEKTFNIIYGMDFDKDSFMDFFNGLIADFEYTIEISISYLLSGNTAIHMLDQEKDKSKKLYVNSTFEGYNGPKQFFKMVDMNIKDPYYITELFNRVCSNAKNKVRKR